MSGNRVVVYQGPGQVAVETIDYPKLELPAEVSEHFGIRKQAPHAAILKIVTTNICGSDQHMVRGRTTAPVGQTLGHEITGEVVEVGDDVLFVRQGDNRKLMNLILSGRAEIAKAVNATTIGLDQAPQGYADFDRGEAKKYVLDPHGSVAS